MIVITTPTGSIGRKVLERLIGSGEKIRVIARDPSRIPAGERERVEVVQGSHGDPAVIDKAFHGAEAVFWVVPPDFRSADIMASYVDFSKPACEAIKRHAVQRVIAVSALGRGTPVEKQAGLVTAALAMSDLIASTGVSFRELVLPSFMDNLLRQVEPIRSHGMFALPLAGDRKVPTCSTGDIAAAAAKLLRDRSLRGRGSAAVLGPEDLSFNEMASIMSEVLAKPVRYQQVPIDAYKSMMQTLGASEAMAQAMVEMMNAKNQGLDNAVPRTPESRSPTSFKQWCADVLRPAVG